MSLLCKVFELIRSDNVKTSSTSETAQDISQHDPCDIDHPPEMLGNAETERHGRIKCSTADRTGSQRPSHDSKADGGYND